MVTQYQGWIFNMMIFVKDSERTAENIPHTTLDQR